MRTASPSVMTARNNRLLLSSSYIGAAQTIYQSGFAASMAAGMSFAGDPSLRSGRQSCCRFVLWEEWSY
jgi:hypothetical protein